MSFNAVVIAFEKCATTPGRNAKLAVLHELYIQHPELFRKVVEYTYNPFWTYRITAKVPEFFGVSTDTAFLDRTFADVLDCLDQLKTGKLGPTAGRAYLETLLKSLPQLWQKYVVQIVNHDLKIGIQSFGSWFPGLIPNEPCMLADKWEGQDVTGWIAEPKIDGLRHLIIVDADSNCTGISRGNKEFYNWEHVAEQIKLSGIRSVVLDGEFYAGSFGLTQSICTTQSAHPERLRLRFIVFDMLLEGEWRMQRSTLTLQQRKSRIRNHLSISLPVEVLEGETITPERGFFAITDSYYARKFEGGMAKKLDSFYVFDRTQYWLKLKPEEEGDLTVYDAEVGSGRHSTRLGALYVEGEVQYRKQRWAVWAKCGGGFKDAERDYFWNLHQQGKLVGRVVQVKFQDVTESIDPKTNTRPSLRFPRFMRERLDKTPTSLL